MAEDNTTNVPANYREVKGSERRLAPGARLVGPADPKEELSVSIRVRRRSDAPALPDQEYWAATPVGQRKFPSRQEFAARYGASEADLASVAEFAAANGLTVLESSIARRTVVVSGTVEQMSRAFAVKLGRYESPTGTYRGREGPVHLPANLVDIVEGVFGLDNRRMARRANGPSGASPLTPPQVAGLYNFPTFGAGGRFQQTIGVLEFGGGYTKSDIQAFFAGLGLVTPTLQDVSILKTKNTPGGADDSEVALDIDVAGSVAQGAIIEVYFAPFTEQGWVDAVTTAIHDSSLTVLSISWGWPELAADPYGVQWTKTAIDAVSATFQEAAGLGVTVFVASGDQGSCSQVVDGHAHVGYPASDPWVTACGGTTIENVSGSSFKEVTWNDSGSSVAGATGGGVSEIFPLPTWQKGVGVPASVNPPHSTGRGIPDVAGNASYYSGYIIVLYGSAFQEGGTSAVAPLYAGLLATINADNGPLMGYLNPTLYTYAYVKSGFTGGTEIFRDIDDGVSNAFDGAPGYKSGKGWDACTGLGVINGKALLTLLTNIYRGENP